MRPVSVFADGPDCEMEQLGADPHGRWREAVRAVMVLLSAHGLPPSQIAALLGCHPATVRRWIGRFNEEGLADRPRSGRPALGGGQLTGRIAALLALDCSRSGHHDAGVAAFAGGFRRPFAAVLPFTVSAGTLGIAVLLLTLPSVFQPVPAGPARQDPRSSPAALRHDLGEGARWLRRHPGIRDVTIAAASSAPWTPLGSRSWSCM